MKKYISVFALSAVLCSQAFAGFDEVSKDIEARDPRRAAATCQKLSTASTAYFTRDPDEAYESIGDLYGQISGYLTRLANSEVFDATPLSTAIEELQSLEEYLGMVSKPIPSTTAVDFSASGAVPQIHQPFVPRGAAATAAYAPFNIAASTPPSRDQQPFSLQRTAPTASLQASVPPPPSGYRSFFDTTPVTLSLPPVSRQSDRQPTARAHHRTTSTLFQTASVPGSSSRRLADMPVPPSPKFETPMEQALRPIVQAPPVVNPPQQEPPKAPAVIAPPKTQTPVVAPPMAQALELKAQANTPLPVVNPPQQEPPKAPAVAPASTQAAVVPAIRLAEAAVTPPVAAPALTREWDDLSNAQKEVGFSIGATLTQLRKKLRDAQHYTDPYEVDHVLDPQALLNWLGERDVDLENRLQDSPTTRESVSANYSRNITAFKEALRASSGQLGPLHAKVNALRSLIEAHMCGEDWSANTQYQGLVRDLHAPLEKMNGELSQKVAELFSTDIWEVRATIFPGVQRSRDKTKQPPAATATVVVKAKISDTLDAKVKDTLSTLNNDIERHLAAKRTAANESIMAIGDGDVARGLFAQIDDNITAVSRHFTLPVVPSITVDTLVQWHGELNTLFPGVAVKELSADRIRATFRHLETRFSNPYKHVGNRIPPREYLKALTFFKTVVGKFKDQPDLSVLVSGVLEGLYQQDLNCGAGAFGRSILLYNTTLQFLMNLEKPA